MRCLLTSLIFASAVSSAAARRAAVLSPDNAEFTGAENAVSTLVEQDLAAQHGQNTSSPRQIVTVGDSITWGHGLDYKQVVPGWDKASNDHVQFCFFSRPQDKAHLSYPERLEYYIFHRGANRVLNLGFCGSSLRTPTWASKKRFGWWSMMGDLELQKSIIPKAHQQTPLQSWVKDLNSAKELKGTTGVDVAVIMLGTNDGAAYIIDQRDSNPPSQATCDNGWGDCGDCVRFDGLTTCAGGWFKGMQSTSQCAEACRNDPECSIFSMEGNACKHYSSCENPRREMFEGGHRAYQCRLAKRCVAKDQSGESDVKDCHSKSQQAACPNERCEWLSDSPGQHKMRMALEMWQKEYVVFVRTFFSSVKQFVYLVTPPATAPTKFDQSPYSTATNPVGSLHRKWIDELMTAATLEEVKEELESVAQHMQGKLRVIDLKAKLAEMARGDEYENKWVFEDGLHFTAEGNEQIAEVIEKQTQRDHCHW